MAFTDNTTYCGKDAQGFYSAALLTGNSKETFKLYSNVKNTLKIARLDMSGLLQEADCTFSDGGSTVLSQKPVTVCPIKVNVEFCKRTFEQNYLSEQLRPGSNNDEVAPASFEEYVLEQIAKNISKDLEFLIWQGDADASPSPSLCDGLIKLLEADGTVIDVTGTTVTAANVIVELAKVYAVIPNTIIDSDKLVLYVSQNVAKAYLQAMAALTGNGGMSYNGTRDLDYLGIKMIVAKGLPSNTIIAGENGQEGNFWFATDLMSDFEDVNLINMNIIGVPTLRMTAEFKFGVGYGVGSEIVLYN